MAKRNAKHLAKLIGGSLVRAWGPGLVVVGLALLGWAYYEHSLTIVQPVVAVSPSSSASPTPTASASVEPTIEPTITPTPIHVEPVYGPQPAIGKRIGTITLPTLKLSWPIYEGTTEAVLLKGVGHYRTSVMPGIRDNSVLSGHRSTVFNRLGELKTGDKIYVKTEAGVFTYEMVSHRVVKRTDRTVIVPTSTAILTLTTCWPFNQVGITTKAYIVTAKLVPAL